jgi:dihydroorotate dehydrogenase
MIPFWRWLPPKWAHDLAPLGVHLWADLFPVESAEWKPFHWKNLHFPNRLGLAGGVDKNGDLLPVWPRLGFGFVEIGTVTPLPQEPNPGKIVDRDWEQKLLWNRMGFPSAGMNEVAAKIETSSPIGVPLFVNVGKNRETPNERAAEDYQAAARRLAPVADALVINVSSPNTQGLRDLQDKTYLRNLVESVVLVSYGKPVLVKFSPDEEEKSLKESLETASEGGAQGFVLTNTTLRRPSSSRFPEVGGLSGDFLRGYSRKALEIAVDHFRHESKPLLISVGGVLNATDVRERLDLGADLVQVYSALVFEGPGFAASVAREMKGLQ